MPGGHSHPRRGRAGVAMIQWGSESEARGFIAPRGSLRPLRPVGAGGEERRLPLVKKSLELGSTDNW
jgi:hypothetical protein